MSTPAWGSGLMYISDSWQPRSQACLMLMERAHAKLFCRSCQMLLRHLDSLAPCTLRAQ